MVTFCVEISTQNDVMVCPVIASYLFYDANVDRFLYFFFWNKRIPDAIAVWYFGILRRIFDANIFASINRCKLIASFSITRRNCIASILIFRRKYLRLTVDAILNLRRIFDAEFSISIKSVFFYCVENKRRNIYFASNFRRNPCVTDFFGDFLWTFSTHNFDAKIKISTQKIVFRRKKTTQFIHYSGSGWPVDKKRRMIHRLGP